MGRIWGTDKEKGHRTCGCTKAHLCENGERIYFLIDEWDCVMRERQESEAMQKHYLDFLRNLLKDQPYVALAYMTGILPVKNMGSIQH